MADYQESPGAGRGQRPPQRNRKPEVCVPLLILLMIFAWPVGMFYLFYRLFINPEMARGLEEVPEGGERCFRCYRLRLGEAAKLAKEGGYDYFTTTLSISPLKNAPKLNEIGEELGEIYGVSHLPSDFKKRDGYKRSVQLSAEYGLYRQDYCGCVFSKREQERRKKERERQEASLNFGRSVVH